MASTTSELSASAGKIKSGAEGLEAEAIGLEIPIRVHGSQMTAVLDATEHAEPFEETTSTMIVFPRGALIKLRAHVRTGHSLVITNQQNNKTTTCRIIQVNNPGSGVHYVKLEFFQPASGFWGVHFPSEPLRSETPSVPEPNELPRAPENGLPKLENTNQSVSTAIRAPQPTSSDTPPREVTRPPEHTPVISEMTPVVQEISRPAEKIQKGKPEYASVASPSELEPLASAPEKPSKKVLPITTFASATRPKPAVSKKAPRTSGADSLPRAGEVSTKAGTNVEADFSGLITAGPAPEKKRSITMKILVAAAILLAAGAGAKYYLGSRSSLKKQTQQTAAVSSPAPAQTGQSIPAAAPVASSVPVAPPPSSNAAITERDVTKPAAVPVKVSEVPAKPVSHAVISTGTADIYAGDLSAARPLARKRTHAVTPSAPALPEFQSSAPKAPDGTAANSLFAGNSNLPAPPAAPKSTLAQGGHLVQARLIHSVPPVYPPLAAANHVEGDVKLQAEINTAGRVISAKVVSGPVLLRNSALSAVHEWRYSPALLDGKPVASQFVVTVIFRLSQN